MRRRVTDTVDRLPYLGEVEDAEGDLVETWGPPAPVGIFELNPGGSIEPLITGQDRVITTPTIYAPYDTPFGAYDKCVIDGVEFTVEGTPARWKHRRTGREVGATVNLKAANG